MGKIWNCLRLWISEFFQEIKLRLWPYQSDWSSLEWQEILPFEWNAGIIDWNDKNIFNTEIIKISIPVKNV